MKKPIINLEDADREVVGSDCMCELGSDEHDRGCKHYSQVQRKLVIDWMKAGLPDGMTVPIFEELVDDLLNATREEVVEQWRKSIDEEGLSCARKIEEAVREERERIQPLVERIRLDVEVIVCDCGEKYKDSDLDISVGDLEQALQKPLPDKE